MNNEIKKVLNFLTNSQIIHRIMLFVFFISFTFAQSHQIEPSLEEKILREKIKKAVVHILANTEERSKSGGGTVIAIEEGKVFVLTAKHVLEGSESFSIKFDDSIKFDGRKDKIHVPKDVSFDDIYYFEASPLAIIPIPISYFSNPDFCIPVPICNKIKFQEEIEVSSPVRMTIPSLYGIDYFNGYINNIEVEHIKFTAPIEEGWSGNALLNTEGYLIGIIEYIDSTGIGKALRADRVKELIEDSLELKNHEIRVNVRPFADVWIDGIRIGEIPPRRIHKVSKGKHILEFEIKEPYKKLVVEVVIKAGENIEIRVDMRTGEYKIINLKK